MNVYETLRENGGAISLSILRIVLACMLIWSFFDKLLGLGLETPSGSGMIDGGSPSSFILYFDGPVAELMHGLAGNAIIDVLLMAALILIGLALLTGIGMKIATLSGTVFFFIMYLICLFPGDNPILDYHLVYIFVLLAVYFYHAGDHLGFGKKWKELDIVKKYKILE